MLIRHIATDLYRQSRTNDFFADSLSYYLCPLSPGTMADGTSALPCRQSVTCFKVCLILLPKLGLLTNEKTSGGLTILPH
jgi:hypothetical protein